MAVTTDALGNIYWAGYFRGTIDLGGTVSERLTQVGNPTPDVFVAKFNSVGDHVWSRRFTASAESEFISIKVDTDGSIYVGSKFTGGSLVKLNPAGDTLWIKGPSIGFQRIDLDSGGNIVATGVISAPFQSQVDFGNGVSLYSQLTSQDAFLCKYNSSGDCLWGRGFANNADREQGVGICVDRTDNSIFLGGWSQLDIYLNGGTGGTSNLPLDTPHYYKTFRTLSSFGFLVKFSSDGNTILWSRALGLGVPSDPAGTFTRVEDLALDGEGNLIVGGHYNFKSDFGAGPYSGTTAVYRNGFVAKYSGSTGSLIWVKPINGNQWLFVTGVAVGPQNSVVAVGYFFGVYDFGGASLSRPDVYQNYNAFIAKYSSTGALDSTKLQQFGSAPIPDAANGVAVYQNHAIMTGYFQATVDFNGTSLTSKGSFDAFLMRLPIA